ncbi:unnamed protein product [Toxocara canis]|uniref:ING domain-containing protein n=1 Tax=Toxocara canis TaxID=6265 RepID=A0A183V9E0_TOXCA|nr:unnamed protein product [Toxocara canis]
MLEKEALMDQSIPRTDLPRTERRDCYQMDDDEWMDEWTELIRDLPGDMRTRIEEIGALDSRIQRKYLSPFLYFFSSLVTEPGDLAQVHETANEFFEEASDLPPEQLAFLYAQLKEEYENIRKDAEEKVEMAEATVSLFLDYKQKIMAKISNFKEFLDARYPGMTEQIESSSLFFNIVDCSFMRSRSFSMSLNIGVPLKS